MYDEINDILYQERRGKVNAIVLGGFKSIVREGTTNKVVFGLGRRDEKSKMLINFWRQHDLVMIYVWFKKRKINLYVWKNPEDQKHQQIDYILVNQCFGNSIRDMKTFPGVYIDSEGESLFWDSCSRRANMVKTNQESWETETKIEFGEKSWV